MTIIRFVNGSDAAVRLSVAETLAALQAKPGEAGFIELPGDDGPSICVRVGSSPLLGRAQGQRRIRMGVSAPPTEPSPPAGTAPRWRPVVGAR